MGRKRKGASGFLGRYFGYLLFADHRLRMGIGLGCRRNSNGLLLGCSLREHKWQKVKMAARASRWGELFGKFRANTSNAAAVSAMAGTGSAIVAALALLTK